MKYSEIQKGSRQEADEIAKGDPALRVIHMLSEYRIFDAWFETLSPTVRDAIFEDIRCAINHPPIEPRSTLPWRVGKSESTIVSDKPTHPDPKTGHGDIHHYGGHLVAESIPPNFAAFIVEVMNQQPPF